MLNELLKSLYFYILPTFYLLFGCKLVWKRLNISAIALGLYFITFSIRSLSSFFLSEKIGDFYIHFHRVQSPLHYLIPAFGFIFTYFAFHPQKKWEIKWYLLFIPFLVHLIEYLPFYFSSAENKLLDLEIANKAGSLINYPSVAGWLPIWIHTLGKYVYTIILFFCAISVFLTYFKSNRSLFFKNNYLLINWIGIDLFIKLLSFIFIILYGLGYFKFTGYEFKPSDFSCF